MNEVFCPDFAVRHSVYTMKDHPGVYKLVVRSRGAVRYSVLNGKGWQVAETHNYHEPYDAAVHVFYLREQWLKQGEVVTMHYRKAMKLAFDDRRKSNATINASVESSVTGIRVTKAYTNAEREVEKPRGPVRSLHHIDDDEVESGIVRRHRLHTTLCY